MQLVRLEIINNGDRCFFYCAYDIFHGVKTFNNQLRVSFAAYYGKI